MKAKLITKTVSALAPAQKPYDVRDTELSGFLLRVMPTGAMAYFCDFRRADGRRTRLKLGDATVLTPAQARDEALKALGDVARGEDPIKKRQSARGETLEGFIKKHYQPWAEVHRKSWAGTVKRADAFPEFLKQKLSDLSAWKLEKWRAQRLKDGKKPATVNRDVAAIRAIIQKAVEWEMIEGHPWSRVKPLKADTGVLVRFLDAKEEKDLRDQLDIREARLRAGRRSHNEWCEGRGYPKMPSLDQTAFADHLKPMVLLSLNTGIRRGELFSLKWDDVDLSRRILTVRGGNAKSGKTRHIPLNNEAAAVLFGWRAQTDSGALVFPGRDGNRFNNVQSSWETLLEDAKIEKFRWHDQRHHFASMLVINGVDLNTVRELMGHADLKQTLRYAHLCPQVKADAVAKLDRRAIAAVSLDGKRNRLQERAISN